MTRRSFLQSAAAQIAGVSLSPAALTPFVDALPIPRVAQPLHRRNGTHYRIAMREFRTKVHRDLPPTTFWGYGGTSPGPTFETRSGEPLTVEWVNELPTRHLFPIDHSLHGAEPGIPDVRTVVHLHGGKVPPESDGNPEKWTVPGQAKLCFYPNKQEAATLFYHDHAMGITRLNAVAGLFGLFLVRDFAEDALRLPQGPYEIPLIIYDRLLHLDGQLQYPPAPWTHEFYGNAILINGTLCPFLNVEPRPYRFRVLNCSNAGFFTLSLARDGLNLVPGTEPFLIIGSDQGLLAAPVSLRNVALTPGERADLIIDFRAYSGQTLYLKHAASPVMQIRVAPGKGSLPFVPPATLRAISRTPEKSAVKTRELTLLDYKDRAGHVTSMLLNGAHYSMPVSETPRLGSVEIWTFVNLTDDTHPLHLHLVRFQILDRRRFDFTAYKQTGKLVFTGPPVPPEPHEAGWKDTVRADVLMATRIIVRFDGFAGRYVWHCHVLEHEDNEMMRPFEVIGG